MMKKWAVIAALAILAVGGGLLAWKIFFPDEKARVVRALDDAAEAVCFEPGDPPAAMLVKTRRLEAALDDRVDVTIRVDRRDYERVMEKKEIVALFTAGRRAGGSLKAGLSDHSVEISGDRAVAEATGSIRYANGGREFSQQEDVTVELLRRDGKWLISRVRFRSFMEK